jgi:ketosteroid isomerase-like protein
MSLENNKAVVREFFDAIQRADWAKVRTLMPESGTYTVPELTRASGTKTREAFIETTATFLHSGNADPFKLTFHRMTAEGDVVCAEVSSQMKLNDGRIYANQYAMLLVIKSGQVISNIEYMNTQHVNDIFGAP